MVTLSFFLLIIFLSTLLALFDMKLYEISFFESIVKIFYSEIAIGRTISLSGAFFGLIWSVVVDFRIYRAKQKNLKVREINDEN
ncbi:hypothetical protein [Neobacillus vireti]|uniref:hypothetical protein n=1 Tax=Neobacillus vireti TaxID=220686 RepID=UPI002FFFAE93